jgi:hypothetical protein
MPYSFSIGPTYGLPIKRPPLISMLSCSGSSLPSRMRLARVGMYLPPYDSLESTKGECLNLGNLRLKASSASRICSAAMESFANLSPGRSLNEKPTPSGCSRKSMERSWVQLHSLCVRATEPCGSETGRRGPCSARKPRRPEQPGPPFVHMMMGSSVDVLARVDGRTKV